MARSKNDDEKNKDEENTESNRDDAVTTPDTGDRADEAGTVEPTAPLPPAAYPAAPVAAPVAANSDRKTWMIAAAVGGGLSLLLVGFGAGYLVGEHSGDERDHHRHGWYDDDRDDGEREWDGRRGPGGGGMYPPQMPGGQMPGQQNPQAPDQQAPQNDQQQNDQQQNDQNQQQAPQQAPTAS